MIGFVLLQVGGLVYTATGIAAEAAGGGQRIAAGSFGIKGDGITNDAPAVQKAINRLRNGDILVFSGTLLINDQILVAKDNITLDFGDAIILNNSTIKKTVWESQSINPVFFINASNVHCRGGWFRNFVSQGFFAGGKFAGKGAKGNTKSSVTFRNMKFSGLVSSVESKCIQTRHVDNVLLENILAEDIGVARTDAYCETLSVNYCDNARIVSSTVRNTMEGGAANFLYVDNGFITGNKFTNTAATSYSVPLSLHVKHSHKVLVSDNVIMRSDGGMSMKISEYTDDIVITNNHITVSGPQPMMFAGIYFQGADNFRFIKNVVNYGGGKAIYVGPHVSVNSRNGYISDNKITTTYAPGDAKVKGSGIYVVGGNIGSDRQPIIITANSFYDSDIYVFQALDCTVSKNVLVNRNTLAVNDRSYGGRPIFAASSSIFIENGDRNIVTGNAIMNEETVPVGNRAGIRILATSNSGITKNNISFVVRTDSSYGIYRETSGRNTVENNAVTNAITSNTR